MQKKLYVPLMNSLLNAESNRKYSEYLSRITADTVFIALDRKLLFMSDERQKQYLLETKNNVDYFKSCGFEVGIWIDSYGFGGYLEEEGAAVMTGEPRITSVGGRTAGDAFCPLGEKFVALSKRRIQNIAKYLSPDMIMLDDELCLSVRPGLGCFCEEHLKLYEKAFGKRHTREELRELIFTEYHETYRKGWLKIVGDTMREFCRKMREALNEVAPTVRMGFCAGFTSWDVEGADAIELTKILAGDTKPFLRLTGAPYWVVKDCRRFGQQKLHEVIECARMQEKWCQGQGVEIFNECDTWPRPAYYTPSNIAEAFYVALLAAGDTGSLKYLFSYDMPCDTELNYYKRHLKNAPLYGFIQKHFSEKSAVGVTVYETQRKIEKTVLPKEFKGDRPIMANLFSHAASLLTIHSIPTTYEENAETGIVFGDNAKNITRLPKKLILDIDAAKILQAKGIDVGLVSAENQKNPLKEQFLGKPPFQYVWGETLYYRCELREMARVESIFLELDGKAFPASYRYQTAETEFLVLCINGTDTAPNSHFFQSYYRQNQLLEFLGRTYPTIENQVGIYTVCKEREKELSVLFINISEDDLFDFEICLNGNYRKVETFGFEGRVRDGRIKVDGSVPAYGTIAVVLKK